MLQAEEDRKGAIVMQNYQAISSRVLPVPSCQTNLFRGSAREASRSLAIDPNPAPGCLSELDMLQRRVVLAGEKIYVVACMWCERVLVVVTERHDLPPAGAETHIRDRGLAIMTCMRWESDLISVARPQRLPLLVRLDWQGSRVLHELFGVNVWAHTRYTPLTWKELFEDMDEEDVQDNALSGTLRRGSVMDVKFKLGVPDGFWNLEID